MVSSAWDDWQAKSIEEMQNEKSYMALKRLLDKDNIIFSLASTN